MLCLTGGAKFHRFLHVQHCKDQSIDDWFYVVFTNDKTTSQQIKIWYLSLYQNGTICISLLHRQNLKLSSNE